MGTQANLSEELREKRKAQEDEVWLEFEDYMRSWDPSQIRRWTASQKRYGS